MRPLRLILASAAVASIAVAAAAAEPQAPAQPVQPRTTTISPFLEFQAAGAGPRASSKDAAGRSGKPRFEMTITTPVTNFAHMRRGPSNTTLECIIPADLRRD